MSTQPFLIISAADNTWAKNFRPRNAPPGYRSPIFFDSNNVGSFEQFNLLPEGGNTFLIRNVGAESFATPSDVDDRVWGSTGVEATQWVIESAGNGQFVIRLPNQDRLWTVRDGGAFLMPADGSAEQRFIFRPVN